MVNMAPDLWCERLDTEAAAGATISSFIDHCPFFLRHGLFSYRAGKTEKNLVVCVNNLVTNFMASKSLGTIDSHS